MYWKRTDEKDKEKVHWQQQVKQTNVDEGGNPKWNEVLEFDLESSTGGKFTLDELQQTKAEIVISLFDNHVYKTFQDGQEVR